jgi:hypothetical protein
MDRTTARAIMLTLISCVLFGCATVPREAVVVSATVGRDLAVVHTAHRELVGVLFRRMRRDVNRFVEEVYAPYQIRFVMDEQRKFAVSQVSEDKRRALLPLIGDAFKEGGTAEKQSTALAAVQILVKTIHAQVEAKRAELLTPLDAQEAEVVAAIDRAYQQIAYANSVVTGHLASVVKVEEAEDELLRDAGVSRDVRGDLSQLLAQASDHIGKVVDDASNAADKVSIATEKADNLKASIADLGHRLAPNKQPTPPEVPNGK